MNKPEAIQHLLVFDSNFEKYLDYFDEKSWAIEIYKPQTPDNFLARKDIEEKYAAIFMDFVWLQEIRADPKEKAFLGKLKSLNIPLIIFAFGNTSDNYKSALLLGASGFLAKEALDRGATEAEVSLIINFHRTTGNKLMIKEPVSQLESAISLLLQQPSVCFPHWDAFFGKTAQAVFKKNALKELAAFPALDLEDVLRTAIFNAHDQKALKIGRKHLGQRFQGLHDLHRELELGAEAKARALLKQFHGALMRRESIDATAIEAAAAECGYSVQALKAKLRSIRAKYPDILVKRHFPLIFEAFPIRSMVVYARESIVEGRVFVEKHMGVLKHSLRLEVFDHNDLLGGAEVSKEIGQSVEKTDLFILLICNDFILNKRIREEIVLEAFLHKKHRSVEILPIRLKYCLLEEFSEISPLEVIPRDGNPVVNAQQNIDEVWFNILHEVKRVALERIWPA